MRKNDAIVTPELLLWARNRIALSTDTIADYVKVPPETYLTWEKGKAYLTVNQARAFAKITKIPFVWLFLDRPPEKRQLPKPTDYRTSPAISTNQITLTRHLIAEVSFRRDAMIELYNELNYPLPKFTIDLDFTSKSEALIAQKIKNLLGLDNDSQAAPKSPDQAFDFYRKSLSDLGILVFQADKIAPRYLRGLSIHDSIFPIIVVNRQDEFNARIFSLFHDFIHILTKTSGICNNFNYKNNDKFDFETWLNKIVSKVLSTEDTHFFNPKKMNKTSQINYRNNPSLDIYSKVGELYASTVFAAFNQHLITARDVSYYFSGLKLEHFSQMEKSYLDPALAGGL